MAVIPASPDQSLVLQSVRSEIEQDGEAEASGGQVIDRLGLVLGVQARESLDLQDDLALDREIGHVVAH